MYKLWNTIEDWRHEKLQVKFNFTVCEFMFGLLSTEDTIFDVLNYAIMYAKHYINSKGSNSKNLLFTEFLCVQRKHLNINPD